MALGVETRTDAEVAPEEVLQLLQAQAEFYEQLATLAGRQRNLITADNAEPLLGILAQRQQLTTRIARLAEKLKPVREQWSAYRAGLAPAQQKHADHLLTRTQELLGRVMASDEQDAKLLKARKEATAGVLRGNQANRAVLAAYQTPASQRGRLDQMHEQS